MSTDDRRRGVIRLRGQQPPAAEERRGQAAAEPAPPVLTGSAPRARFGRRGTLHANLNWRPGADADVNLCCLVSFKDGTARVVQALADAHGSLTEWPYIALDHDDRTGDSSDGETLRVDLGRGALFDRLLFFVYIYEGAADFRRLGAAVTVTSPDDPGCRILLDDSPEGAVACAIALIAPDDRGITVRREVRWFTDLPGVILHEQIDRAYGFGLDWTPAAKPPRDLRAELRTRPTERP
ncbi:tellurium resistance protein TerA [Streptomyces sp. NPDC005566]|uniref:tellurium resistance protein TerA n=1 Tax=Streptomyces sp. NPDC005566 TaxID=3156886 RepID=UPI0033B9F143